MKTLFLALLVSISGISFAQKPCKVTVSFHVENIEQGYEHKVKNEIYIDGIKFTETKEYMESQGYSFVISVPKGEHEFMVKTFTFYEGNWEEQTITNGYSTDAFFTRKIQFRKKLGIDVTFDLDSANPIVEIK